MRNTICFVLVFVLLVLNANILVLAAGSGVTIVKQKGDFNPNDYNYDKDFLELMKSGRFPFNEDDFQNYKKYENVHPRLFLDQEKVDYIITEIGEGGKYYDNYERLIKRAEGYLLTTIPGWPEGGLGTTASHRPVGDALAALATAYLFTKDSRYYYGIKDGCYAIKPTIEMACLVYPSWGVEQYNRDLVFSHIVVGMSLVWDYCQGILDKETKDLMLETIKTRGEFMYIASKGYTNWGHNHPMINHTSMAFFALSAFEEMDNPDDWLRGGLNYMHFAFRLLADDGSYHEGQMYANYALEFMIPYAKLAKKFFNTNLFLTTEYFKEYKNWVIHNRVRTKAGQNILIPFNNSALNSGGLDTIISYALADEFNDPDLQFVAENLKPTATSSFWYEMLFYNPDVPMGRDFRDYAPTTHYFDDLEIISTRPSWDEGEPLLSFKCGPHLGHAKCSPTYFSTVGKVTGSGHADPDIGHFCILGYDNEWIFMDDVGYGYTNTITNHHNTLMIDGKGQIGDTTAQFMNDVYVFQRQVLNPYFETIVESEDYLYFVGDLTEAYDKSLGLKKFKRHFLYVKPNVLIVLDDIDSNGEHEFNIRYLPETSTLVSDNNNFYFSGKKNSTDVISLTPEGAEIYGGLEELVTTYSPLTTTPKAVINYKKTASSWVNAVGIAWDKSDGESITPEITMKQNGSAYTFNVGKYGYIIDIDEQTIKPASSSSKYIIRANGENIPFKTDSCFLIDGSLYAGYKEFSGALGIKISWNENNAILKMEKDDFALTADFQNEVFIYDNPELQLKNDRGVTPKIVNNELVLPVRFIAEATGYGVLWDGAEDYTELVDDARMEAIGNAQLKKIFFNENEIKGFAPNVFEYEAEYDLTGTNISVIPNSKKTSYSIDIQMENEDAKVAYIRCTNLLSGEKLEYKINLESIYNKGVGNVQIKNVIANADEERRKNTVDSDMASYWAAPGRGDYITYEFANATSVEGMAIAFSQGASRIGYFDIFTSMDGENWTHVLDGASGGKTTELESFKFGQPTKCKYLKLVSKGSSTSTYLTLLEVAIFGLEEE